MNYHFAKMEYDQEFYVMIWDLRILSLFKFDGIIYNPDEPYYDERNEYLNIHIRHSHPYDGENAFSFLVYIFSIY